MLWHVQCSVLAWRPQLPSWRHRQQRVQGKDQQRTTGRFVEEKWPGNSLMMMCSCSAALFLANTQTLVLLDVNIKYLNSASVVQSLLWGPAVPRSANYGELIEFRSPHWNERSCCYTISVCNDLPRHTLMTFVVHSLFLFVGPVVVKVGFEHICRKRRSIKTLTYIITFVTEISKLH